MILLTGRVSCPGCQGFDHAVFLLSGLKSEDRSPSLRVRPPGSKDLIMRLYIVSSMKWSKKDKAHTLKCPDQRFGIKCLICRP